MLVEIRVLMSLSKCQTFFYWTARKTLCYQHLNRMVDNTAIQFKPQNNKITQSHQVTHTNKGKTLKQPYQNVKRPISSLDKTPLKPNTVDYKITAVFLSKFNFYQIFYQLGVLLKF